MRMRRKIKVTGHDLEYKAVSYSSMALLARHGILAFCRVRRVPGSNAVRFVDRPLPPERAQFQTYDAEGVELTIDGKRYDFSEIQVEKA